MATPTCERAFGSNHIRYTGGDTTIRLTTDAPLAYIDREVAVRAVAPDRLVVRRRHAVRGRPREHLPRVRRAHARLLAGMDAPARHLLRMAGRGDARRDHAEAVELRGDRRDHRGADHLGSGSARLGPHLGLPLLLAARRLFRGARAQPHRRDAHDGELHLLHPHHRDRARPASCSRSTASSRPIRSRSASSPT